MTHHNLLCDIEYHFFWDYWNHGYECNVCRRSLCTTGNYLRTEWEEALEMLNAYEDGTLLWTEKRC